MINFNKPPYSKNGVKYMQEAIVNNKICGDGSFTKKTSEWFEKLTGESKVLMTTSCTHAIEMAALLCEIKEGDEVIMASFTFVSSANPFVLRGAKIVFIDIDPKTMNMDVNLIERAITPRTRVIVPMHYGGVACDMDRVMEIADRYKLIVVEDAAQGVLATYKGKYLGSIGHYGAYSFHETKNYTMGEGGALLIKDKEDIISSEIIREKGTNRSQFHRGQVDKYTWLDVGSSYLPSELNVAYLYGQLEEADEINVKRLNVWNTYHKSFKLLKDKGYLELPYIPEDCIHNAHMYYIKTVDLETRTKLIEFLKDNGIGAVFHYVPLHSSPAGKKFSRFSGEDKYTTIESERLIRLPMYFDITEKEVAYVISKVTEFFM